MTGTSSHLKPVSISTFAEAFPDEESCRDYQFHHARGLAHRCLATSKRPRWKPLPAKNRYRCTACQRIECARAHGIFRYTKTPVRTIFYGMLLMLDMPGHVSTRFLKRQLGISHKGALALIDRTRLHMAALEPVRPIGGPGKTVWIDETLVRRRDAGAPTCVVGITDAENLFLKAVPDRTAGTLVSLIEEAVVPGSVLVTDGFRGYCGLGGLGWTHHAVNHSKWVWTDAEGRSTAHIDSVWRWLKRQIGGINGPASEDEMWKYIKQFLYKFHARSDPAQAYWKLISTYPPAERYRPDILRREVDCR